MRRVVWALVLVAVVAGCTSGRRSPAPTPSSSPPVTATPVVTPANGRVAARTVLAWSFGGYSPATTSRLLPALGRGATAVATGSLPIASGTPAYPEIPVETAAVDPGPFARAMGESGLAVSLARAAVVSTTESRLRKVSVGGSLHLVGGGSLTVAAVVPDAEIGGYEVALSRTHGARLGITRTGYLLVTGASTSRVLAAVRPILGSTAVRVRRAGVRPFLRAADDVVPQALIKARFGEFAIRRTAGGFAMDPAWVRAHIVTRQVPILGSVTCNRGVVTDIAAAMRDLEARGLANLVDVADFHRNGGCFNARLLRGSTDSISRHAWGVAIDVNVAANPLGGKSRQDPRLIAAFERHQLTWGGGWLRPDPQHFEWVGDVPAYTETA